MKHTTTTVLLSLLAGTTAIATETPDWVHTRLATEYLEMIPANGGGVTVMGETRTETTLSDSDVFISRLNADGVVQWSHQWKGILEGPDPVSGTDRFVDAAARPDGGVAILGRYIDQDEAGDVSTRLAVTQLDDAGEVLSWTDLEWDTEFSTQLESTTLAMSHDGRMLISRSETNFNPASLMSVDAAGTQEWTVDLHEATIQDSYIRVVDLVAGPEGRALMTGEIITPSATRGMLAVSIDASGDLEWFRVFNAPIAYGFQEGAAAVDAEGNLHVCGDLVNLDSDSTIHVAKIDPQGDLLWEYNLDVEETSFFPTEMEVAENGNVYVSAHFYQPDGEGSFHGGFHAVSLDGEGQSLWADATNVIPTASSIQSTGLAVSADGRVHVYGSGWIANQNSAHLMTTWHPDGSVDSIDIWDNHPGHEKITDACYDENNEFYFCGRGEYINFRHSGIVCHFPDTFCLGDLDQNGAVDVTDLLSMLAAFGTDTMPAADLDDDGSVDVNDLLMLIERWGECEV